MVARRNEHRRIDISPNRPHRNVLDPKQDISSCITSELEDTSRSLSSPSKKRAHSSMISSIKNTDDSTPISDLVSKSIVADSTNFMNVYDIGFYINRTLSQNEISDIMNNLWVPDINYKFPIKMYMKKKQANKFKVSIFVASEVSMAMLFRKRMRRFL